MRIKIVSLDEIAEQYLPFSTLERLWDFSPGVMPPTISLSSLSLDVQAHDTVAFVRIPSIHPTNTYVFKSAVHEVRLTYHELRVLISISPHEHILPKPLFIVTMTDKHGVSDLVCGFIVQFFSGGNLAGILSSRGAVDKLVLKDQLRWAQQITRTVIFINESPAEFYPELKADNILLSTSKGTEDVLIIDFEQTGTWMEFSPPEVNFLRTLERLAESPEFIPEERRKHYLDFAQTIGVDGSIEETIYTNPPRGYFKTWLMLSAMEMEAAEVYSLGMTLWCIFEGIPSNRNPMRRSWHIDHLQEFPEFRRSPARIRKLILECVRGWEAWSLEILVRRGAMMYPPGKTGRGGEPLGTALETQEAGIAIWRRWLDDMEPYLWARKRWQDGCASEADLEMLGFPKRPKLQGVLDELDDILREHLEAF
ncbi:hypothetical protein B0O99DRAFT_634361 [Bisporella sp. PMI_857]|nr:hypothetical protein B0O99DRAFT_634361 [Bisporella sp. PMI_857]